MHVLPTNLPFLFFLYSNSNRRRIWYSSAYLAQCSESYKTPVEQSATQCILECSANANYALRDLVNWIGLTSVARSHALSYRFSKIIPRFRSNMQIMSRSELFEFTFYLIYLTDFCDMPQIFKSNFENVQNRFRPRMQIMAPGMN